MAVPPRKRSGSRARKARDNPEGSVLDNIDVPSHSPGIPARAGNPTLTGGTILAGVWPGKTIGGPDLNEVERLAGQGLTLDEILVELGWEQALRPSHKLQLEAAIKRGRAKGSAALKRAHYDAAIGGQVSAQARMLTLLEEDKDSAEPAETEFIVERVMVGGKTKTD